MKGARVLIIMIIMHASKGILTVDKVGSVDFGPPLRRVAISSSTE